MIKVKNVTLGYAQNIIIQQKLNFAIKDEEIFFIVGPSGCGKSTLLNHLIGLNQPIKGQTLIDNLDFYKQNQTKKQKLKQSFGISFQSGALLSNLTLLENVSLPLLMFCKFSKNIIQDIALLKLKLVDLVDFANFYPHQISGGMKKRAAIARAIVMEPKYLFFDEPSAGLDPIASRELDELIFSINKNLRTTIIVISHELTSINKIAKKVCFLDNQEKTALEINTPLALAKSKHQKIRSFFKGNEL